MLDLIVLGAILLLAGLLGLAVGRLFGGDYRQLKNATARRCSDLGAADVGQICEVQGATAAGPEGTVRGPYSGAEGVWAAAEVRRHWTKVQFQEDGYATVKRDELILETERGLPFHVVDGSGRVAVADVVPQQVRDFPGTVRRTGNTEKPEGYEPRGKPKDNEHYAYEEWVLPAGVPMWVSGAVKRHGSGMAIGDPDGRGEVLLNAAPAGETVGETRYTARLSYALGAVGVLLGGVLIALGVA